MTLTNLVDEANVHHQGAGAPSDNLDEPATKGYVLLIGVTKYLLARPPNESFATYGRNHVSFDVMFSGDRNVYPITAHDIRLLELGAADGRARGWLVDAPYVRPHREVPNNFTICCGNRAAYADPPRFPIGDPLAWLSIVTALHKETPPMPPQVNPEFFPAVGAVSLCRFQAGGIVAAAMVDATGAVFCDPASAYRGGANTHRGKGDYFEGRTAAKIDPRPGGGYVITDTADETYQYP